METSRETGIAFDRTTGTEFKGTGPAGYTSYWAASLWLGAYVVLTAAFLLVGAVLTLSVLSVVPAGVGTVVVVFALGLGSVAFAPTGAKVVLIGARDRMDARAGSARDRVPMGVDPEATRR